MPTGHSENESFNFCLKFKVPTVKGEGKARCHTSKTAGVSVMSKTSGTKIR